jgi:hypothetical protein
VVVSVTDRLGRDLTERFDKTEIGWPVIESSLWREENSRTGKKIRVDLSFNYLETSQQPAMLSKTGDKRSLTSAT